MNKREYIKNVEEQQEQWQQNLIHGNATICGTHRFIRVIEKAIK